MCAQNEQNKTRSKILKRKTKQRIFYYSIVALPLLQFLFFYVYVNFSNIILAFKEFSRVGNDNGGFVLMQEYTISNFKNVIQCLQDKGYLFKNSFIMFCVMVFIQYPLALIFSFYIYKKLLLSKLYKFVLFMPQIVSGLVFGLLFKYMVTDVYLEIIPNPLEGGLLGYSSLSVGRATIIFFNVWISFGVNVLLFSGSMSGINDAIVESAQLDGVNLFQEFIHITIPMIYNTIVSLFVVSLAAVLTDQMNLLTLYGAHANSYSSLGYYMYLQALGSDIISPNKESFLSYPELAALGLLLTLISLPVILTIKKLLTKYGPSEV